MGVRCELVEPQRVALAKGGLLVGALVTFLGLSISALSAMVPEI